jgi:hypothetical protein
MATPTDTLKPLEFPPPLRTLPAGDVRTILLGGPQAFF